MICDDAHKAATTTAPWRVRALRDAPVPEMRMTAASTSPSGSSSTSGVGGDPLVFVVDDDISVRESLEALIRVGGWRAEAFDSARAFLARPIQLVPSCLLLDVNLPDLNGLDLQQSVAAERAYMPIIFITGYGDVQTTVRAMKAGAVEFLTKPFDADTLLEAIRTAIERSREALADEAERRALLARYESLSPREREVMTLVVEGLLNKQVGSDLGISEITVKAHRGSVMRKMHATSLPDLVHMAARLDLRRLTRK